jgi:hypothetical protein
MEVAGIKCVLRQDKTPILIVNNVHMGTPAYYAGSKNWTRTCTVVCARYARVNVDYVFPAKRVIASSYCAPRMPTDKRDALISL